MKHWLKRLLGHLGSKIACSYWSEHQHFLGSLVVFRNFFAFVLMALCVELMVVWSAIPVVGGVWRMASCIAISVILE